MSVQVLVVSGGASTEHDVSLASGGDVLASLRASSRFSVLAAHIDREGLWHLGDDPHSAAASQSAADVLDELSPQTVVFPVLHGGWGEGGGLQRELERRRIPFVGCDAASAARALSKSETQRACAAVGVNGIPTRIVHRHEYLADPDLVGALLARGLDAPVVVKPDAGGSSIGVHVVPRGRSLRAAFDDVFAQDAIALVQPLITGHEVSVGVWTDAAGRAHATGASLLRMPQGSAPGFSYEHKYEGAGAVLEIPATLPAQLVERLQRQALLCFTAVGCSGLARIDFFVDDDGEIVLNEINTMPGLRRASHFPRLAAAAGLEYDELLAGLVEVALVRERARLERVSAG